MMSEVTLYHFTARAHLDSILADGFLDVTESNVSMRREHAGPDVVWLTTNPDPSAHDHGLTARMNGVSKKAIRFAVKVDRRAAHKWRDWATRHGIDRGWLTTLAKVGGSSTWRVVERPIPASQWIEIWDVERNRPIEHRWRKTTWRKSARNHAAGSESSGTKPSARP